MLLKSCVSSDVNDKHGSKLSIPVSLGIGEAYVGVGEQLVTKDNTMAKTSPYWQTSFKPAVKPTWENVPGLSAFGKFDLNLMLGGTVNLGALKATDATNPTLSNTGQYSQMNLYLGAELTKTIDFAFLHYLKLNLTYDYLMYRDQKTSYASNNNNTITKNNNDQQLIAKLSITFN